MLTQVLPVSFHKVYLICDWWMVLNTTTPMGLCCHCYLYDACQSGCRNVLRGSAHPKIDPEVRRGHANEVSMLTSYPRPTVPVVSAGTRSRSPPYSGTNSRSAQTSVSCRPTSPTANWANSGQSYGQRKRQCGDSSWAVNLVTVYFQMTPLRTDESPQSPEPIRLQPQRHSAITSSPGVM